MAGIDSLLTAFSEEILFTNPLLILRHPQPLTFSVCSSYPAVPHLLPVCWPSRCTDTFASVSKILVPWFTSHLSNPVNEHKWTKLPTLFFLWRSVAQHSYLKPTCILQSFLLYPRSLIQHSLRVGCQFPVLSFHSTQKTGQKSVVKGWNKLAFLFIFSLFSHSKVISTFIIPWLYSAISFIY